MASNLILHDAYTKLILYSTQHKGQQTDTALSQTHNFINKSLLFLKESWDVIVTGVIIFIITSLILNLTFIGPCIVMYSYSKTNKMHLFLKLFIPVKHSTCFRRSSRPSSGAPDCTYSNRYMSNWNYRDG